MSTRTRRIVSAATLVIAAACGGGEDELTKFCSAASDTEAFEEIFADFDPSDAESATDAFRTALETERSLRRLAPDDVGPDIDLLVQFLDDLVEDLEVAADADRDPAVVYDSVRTRFAEIESASERIESFVRENC